MNKVEDERRALSTRQTRIKHLDTKETASEYGNLHVSIRDPCGGRWVPYRSILLLSPIEIDVWLSYSRGQAAIEARKRGLHIRQGCPAGVRTFCLAGPAKSNRCQH